MVTTDVLRFPRLTAHYLLRGSAKQTFQEPRETSAKCFIAERRVPTADCLFLLLLHRRQHLFRVTFGLYLGEDLCHAPLLVD
jgi:hypothetical protein